MSLYKKLKHQYAKMCNMPLRQEIFEKILIILFLVLGVINTILLILIGVCVLFPDFLKISSWSFILLNSVHIILFGLCVFFFFLSIMVTFVSFSWHSISFLWFLFVLTTLSVMFISAFVNILLFFDYPIASELSSICSFSNLKYVFYIFFGILWQIPVISVVLFLLLRSFLFFLLSFLNSRTLFYLSLCVFLFLMWTFGSRFLRRVFYSALLLVGLSYAYIFVYEILYFLITLYIIYCFRYLRLNTRTITFLVGSTLFAFDFLLFLDNPYCGLPVIEQATPVYSLGMLSMFVNTAKASSEKLFVNAVVTEIQKADYSVLSMKPEASNELRTIHKDAGTGIEVSKLAETHPLYVKTEDLNVMNEKQEGSVIAHVLTSKEDVKEIRDDGLEVVAKNTRAVFCVSDGTEGRPSYFTGQSIELSYEESTKYFQETTEQKKFEAIFQTELETGAEKMMEKHNNKDPKVYMSDFTARRSSHDNLKR